MRSLPSWEGLTRTAAWGVGPCGVIDGGGYTSDRRQLLRKDVLLLRTIDVLAACACIAFLTSWWSARGRAGRPPDRYDRRLLRSCLSLCKASYYYYSFDVPGASAF